MKKTTSLEATDGCDRRKSARVYFLPENHDKRPMDFVFSRYPFAPAVRFAYVFDGRFCRRLVKVENIIGPFRRHSGNETFGSRNAKRSFCGQRSVSTIDRRRALVVYLYIIRRCCLARGPLLTSGLCRSDFAVRWIHYIIHRRD